MRTLWKSVWAGFLVLVCATAFGQEPIDLFADSVKLGDGYLRLASWNLEHIDLKAGARDLLPGDTEEEDFASLISTFAKAIGDLDLDLVVAVEVQPRQNEPDRLAQIRDRLNVNAASSIWNSLQTNIPYDNPNNAYSNLQFGLIWKSDVVEVDEDEAQLLAELRQPRSASGGLLYQRLRIPWLVSIRSGELECDLLIVHLKSGGEEPQAAEVEAICQFIRQRLSATQSRHLIMLGDWNIRPDAGQGRGRLEQLQVSTPNGNLMRILTIEQIRPTLGGWQTLGTFNATHPVADLVPFTHFNDNPQYQTIDTMLDHIAISRSMDEIFDNPIRTQLASGGTDLRPGIEIARPMKPEEDFTEITDHVPVILTLRTSGINSPEPPDGGPVRIVAAIPNPTDPDPQFEQVSIRNFGTEDVSLAGWKIGDSKPDNFWNLDPVQYNDADSIAPGQTVVIVRQRRPMGLNNDGDTIRLIDDQDHLVDSKTYTNAESGQTLHFE